MLIGTVFLTQTRQFPRPVAVAKTESTASWPIWIRSIFSANVFSPNAESLQLQSRKKMVGEKKHDRGSIPKQGLFPKNFNWHQFFGGFLVVSGQLSRLHGPTSFPATHTTRWPPWWYGADCSVKAVADFWLQPCETEMFSQVTHFLFVKRISPIWKDHHCKTTFVMNEFQFTNVTPLFILMLRSCCQGKNGAPETASLGIP